MDDGRKGYVSGADLMTLQAVDAANLSEHDLQEKLLMDGKQHGMHAENVWKMSGILYIYIYIPGIIIDILHIDIWNITYM